MGFALVSHRCRSGEQGMPQLRDETDAHVIAEPVPPSNSKDAHHSARDICTESAHRRTGGARLEPRPRERSAAVVAAVAALVAAERAGRHLTPPLRSSGRMHRAHGGAVQAVGDLVRRVDRDLVEPGCE